VLYNKQVVRSSCRRENSDLGFDVFDHLPSPVVHGLAQTACIKAPESLPQKLRKGANADDELLETMIEGLHSRPNGYGALMHGSAAAVDGHAYGKASKPNASDAAVHVDQQTDLEMVSGTCGLAGSMHLHRHPLRLKLDRQPEALDCETAGDLHVRRLIARAIKPLLMGCVGRKTATSEQPGNFATAENHSKDGYALHDSFLAAVNTMPSWEFCSRPERPGRLLATRAGNMSPGLPSEH
jgi:hypothetical protein